MKNFLTFFFLSGILCLSTSCTRGYGCLYGGIQELPTAPVTSETPGYDAICSIPTIDTYGYKVSY